MTITVMFRIPEGNYNDTTLDFMHRQCAIQVRFDGMGWGGGDRHIRLSRFPFFGVACFFEFLCLCQ